MDLLQENRTFTSTWTGHTVIILGLLQENRTFTSTWTGHMVIIMGLRRDMVSLISGLIWIVHVDHTTALSDDWNSSF